MGKLKDLVKEETSLTNRIKYNTRRLRLAGLGLISKVESERDRLYKELMKAGEGAGDESTLIGVLNTLGAGAAKMVREETQRIFEELVELGEKAATVPSVEEVISKAKAAAKAAESIATGKVGKPKLVAAATDSAADLLQRAVATLAKIDDSLEERVHLEALVLQASEGDVKGRRPAATKATDRALFDARKELKSLSAEAALEQFFAQAKKLKKGQPA